MGLIFKRYREVVYCAKCKVNHVEECSWAGEETPRLQTCPDCHNALEHSKRSRGYFVLRGTNVRIAEGSELEKLFVFWPTIVFGFVGIGCFLLFLLEAVSMASDAISEAWNEIYGETGLLVKWFGNSYAGDIGMLVSLYFLIRVAIFLVPIVQNARRQRQRPF